MLKKVLKICIVIIVVGIIINVIIYFNRAGKTNVAKENENTSINNNKAQENLTVENKINYYYDIKRTKLDRPVAYMINNIKEALPQSGIYGADYIYEMQVEGGLSRLMAIFTRGDIQKIGPIRSARHNFLDIAMEYDAIYSYFGGSPQAFMDISQLKIPNLNGIALDGLMYWRDKSRKAPHNSYTSIEKTLEYSEKYGYNKVVDKNNFIFASKDTTLDGYNAQRVDIKYSYSQITQYTYNEDSKLYSRSMNNSPHMDELLGDVLKAKNIIIQYAEHKSIDDENRQDIKLVGSGRGMYITNGRYINIEWKKASRSAKTFFYNENGEEIALNKGQTWIQIVPTTSLITIE